MTALSLRPDLKSSKLQVIFLFFTFSSFIIMTFGSLYIEMYPGNPGMGEFFIGASGPVFWTCCGAWIIYNLVYIFENRR